MDIDGIRQTLKDQYPTPVWWLKVDAMSPRKLMKEYFNLLNQARIRVKSGRQSEQDSDILGNSRKLLGPPGPSYQVFTRKRVSSWMGPIISEQLSFLPDISENSTDALRVEDDRQCICTHCGWVMARAKALRSSLTEDRIKEGIIGGCPRCDSACIPYYEKQEGVTQT